MALEIKELHIKVNVSPPEEQESTGGKTTSSVGSALDLSTLQNEIIAICMERIFEILQEKKEA